MKLQLKPAFTLCESYITPAEYRGRVDTVAIDHAWVVMFRDEYGEIDQVDCWRDGGAHHIETVDIAPGECWQTAAHNRFVALGWTSPWEEAP